jgi:FixJ family two-component response regulator/signal transduction histidine kinase
MAMTVLLVDDEAGIRKVLGISLADVGYEVHTAGDGRVALEKVKELLPDIVLTDIRMPGMNGIDLLKSIKEQFADIEVIMITGHGDLRLAIESLKMDAVDFITKPINNDILEIALKRATDRIETRKQIAGYTKNLEELVREKTQKLERSEKRYIQLFNESPSFITLQNKKFEIIESNNRFKEQFGEASGICCYQAYKNRSKPCTDCPVEKTFLDGKSHVAEMDVLLKDGSVRNLLIHTSAVIDPSGKIEHVMEMSTDVTMIHELQDHLAALGLHISSISHGIKGILTGLDGGDYLISTGIQKKDTALVADGWDIVKEKIAMVRRMVLDILYHSKDRSLEISPVGLFDFIQELITILDPKMKKAGIVLTLNIPGPGIQTSTKISPKKILPKENLPQKIFIDKHVLLPAFLAILENAIDACIAVKEIKKHLEIKIDVTGKEGAILFKIRDNGKGLAKNFQKEVFSLFYSDKGKKGTGLGLFIAQRAVKQHKGMIKIDSNPGEFTQVCVSLPIK